MPQPNEYLLEISAGLEGISSMTISNDYEFHLKVRCQKCQTETNEINFKLNRLTPILGGRALVSGRHKCSNCNRFLDVVLDKHSVRSYTDAYAYRPLLRLKCVNCKPSVFIPRSGFLAICSRTQHCYGDIDLYPENCWVEFDDEANQTLSIIDFSYRFTDITGKTSIDDLDFI